MTVAATSDLSTDFYAPNFQVEVEGQNLDPETHGDVLSVKVVLDLENLSRFDLTINNWDDGRIDFKYSDKKTFDVCNRVNVKMGYAGRMVSVLHGPFTTLTPSFPESGRPTLGVSGLDSLFLLRDSKPDGGEVTKYEKMTDGEIAAVIAERHGLKADVGKGWEKRALVIQKNQDDAQFLMERAVRLGFELYMQTDEKGKESLHFKKPADGRDATRTKVYVLEWGSNRSSRVPPRGSTRDQERHLLHGLISFSPQLTISRQVSKLTVRGWNSETKNIVSYTATAADLARVSGSRGKSGPETVRGCLGDRKKEVVVDAPVLSKEEAKELAIGLLQERAQEFVTGTGQMIGVPDLRPAQNVELRGLGQRFSGLYYVTRVTHSIGSSGFLTTFDARRTHDGGLKS